MNLEQTKSFVDALIRLQLPRTPSFKENAEHAAFVKTWSEAFERFDVNDIRAIFPRLRDRMKAFPTIPEIKEMIAEYYGTSAQFAPKQKGVTERVINGKVYRTEELTHGYTVTHIDGKPVLPPFTVMTDSQKINATTSQTRSSKPLPRINLRTLIVTDEGGNKIGDISANIIP